MIESRYQHTSEELRYVSQLLDALNSGNALATVGACSGSVDIFWCDSLMGRVECEDEQWVYIPVGRIEPDEK